MKLAKPLIERQCEVCNAPFTTIQAEINRGNGRFCSRSCSSKRTRKEIVYNCKCANCEKELYRKPRKLAQNKTGLFFCNKICMNEHEWRKQSYGKNYRKGYGFCIECNNKLTTKARKFCSVTCQTINAYNEYIKNWLNGKEDGASGEGGISTRIRKWLFEKYDNKCQECGWSKVHSITGKIPLTINHIDGNWTNNHPDNLELLCPNCHALTPNFGSLNKGNGRPKRRLIAA